MSQYCYINYKLNTWRQKNTKNNELDNNNNKSKWHVFINGNINKTVAV